MPRELLATAIRTAELKEYTDQPLQKNEIRARTIFGAPKHGTELHLYRGDSPFGDSVFSEQRLFIKGDPGIKFPIGLGNIAVGLVTEVGPDVQGFKVGDRVAAYGGLRETQRWNCDTKSAYPGLRVMPQNMDWQSALCLDPATVALGGIRDANVRMGDRVAVFGLGAIGLLAVQMCKLAGASRVIAVDPLAVRREVASKTGADVVIDPVSQDAGLEIRKSTGELGVDVALETSGNARALHHALRGLAYRGTVAMVAWYNEIRGGLDFGREAHFNRPKMVFPRAESEPHDDHPRWNNRRQADSAWELLAANRIDCKPVIHPIVNFEDVAAAYREYVDEHPERSVKLGVKFG